MKKTIPIIIEYSMEALPKVTALADFLEGLTGHKPTWSVEQDGKYNPILMVTYDTEDTTAQNLRAISGHFLAGWNAHFEHSTAKNPINTFYEVFGGRARQQAVNHEQELDDEWDELTTP